MNLLPHLFSLLFIVIWCFSFANLAKITVTLSEILEANKNASTYKLPTNNNGFFTNNFDDSNIIDYGSYDFILVGGGTSAGVLVNRLTENKKITVLVIEAGPKDPAWASVLGINALLLFSDWNWGYWTTPQTHSCRAGKSKKCFYPRGKSLGGSSIINGAMYVRGNKVDYDRWEDLGNPGWSYRDCLPYFKKSERAEFTKAIDKKYHGFDGPQHINMPPDTPNLTPRFLDAFKELGKKEIDYNGESQNGVSRMQFYLDYNIRASSSEAFVRPVESRNNLNITLQALVTKIKISTVNRTAYGVEFVKDGKLYLAKAKKEVIVCAGTINSPQVLMLSGIGPKAELRKHGIEVLADLPVGENMKDHIYYPGILYRTNHTFYNNSIEENYELWKKAKRPYNAGVGVHVVSFMNFEGPDNRRPETEVFVGGTPTAEQLGFDKEYTESFKTINKFSDFTMNLALLHPQSTGKITLQSKDPRDFPLIDTNYFSDPKDLETMYKGIQYLLKLNDTETFKNWHAQLFLIPMPGCDANYTKMSKEWWFCSLRYLSVTLYHPIGTTRMGTNPKTSVVDSKFKVHGIKQLRIVDAGVIPSTVSGHTNAAVVMIAEKIVDVIKSEYK